MKKIGTLALTLALAGSLTVPALAAEETAVPISADTGYGTALVLNGETLDLTGIPGVEGGTLLPLRLLAEADHGSAYWDEENNESWFYFGDNRITVSFADSSVTVNDAPVEVDGVAVVGGVTFVSADVKISAAFNSTGMLSMLFSSMIMFSFPILMTVSPILISPVFPASHRTHSSIHLMILPLYQREKNIS